MEETIAMKKKPTHALTNYGDPGISLQITK